MDEAEELPDPRPRSRARIRTAALQTLSSTRLAMALLWHYRHRRLGKHSFNHEADRCLPDYYRAAVERRIPPSNLLEMSREAILNLAAEMERIWVKAPRFSIDSLESLAGGSLALNPPEGEIPWRMNVPEKGNLAVLELPLPHRGDLSIDATWSKDDESQSQGLSRYSRGPKWNYCSCAFDALVMLALLTELGRTEVDQLPLANLAGLSERSIPATVLRKIVAKDWANASAEDINVWRDILRSSVREEQARISHSKLTNFESFINLVDMTMEGARQYMWTGLRTGWCPSCRIVSREQNRAPSRHMCLAMTFREKNGKSKFEDEGGKWLLQHYFDPDEIPADPPRVCQACKTKLHSILVVADRLPPTLILASGFESITDDRKVKEMELVYQTLHRKPRRVKYQLAGVVHGSGNHFALSWYPDDGQIWEYDGLVNEGIVRSSSHPTERFAKMMTTATILRRVSDRRVVSEGGNH